MMVTEFIYMCHGKMFDSDTGKPFHIILKYSNNYDGYCTVEDVVIQIRDTHTTCIKLHPGCTLLYIIDYSENHHKIATNSLNARKLKPKNGGRNTPLIHNGYYKHTDGAIVVHVMQTKYGVHKVLCAILSE